MVKLPIWFFGYKIKCHKCGNIMDFSQDKRIYRVLWIFNSIFFLTLGAFGSLIRGIIVEKFGISFALSMIIVFAIGALIIISIITPIYHMLIYYIYNKFNKD